MFTDDRMIFLNIQVIFVLSFLNGMTLKPLEDTGQLVTNTSSTRNGGWNHFIHNFLHTHGSGSPANHGRPHIIHVHHHNTGHNAIAQPATHRPSNHHPGNHHPVPKPTNAQHGHRTHRPSHHHGKHPVPSETPVYHSETTRGYPTKELDFDAWEDSWLSEHQQICGASSIEPSFSANRIIGGMTSVRGSWPWMVSIYATPFEQHICAGSLIDESWVLTAAHCFRGLLCPFRSSLVLRLGLHNSSKETMDEHRQIHNIDKVFIHPGFNADVPLNNDIALVKLRRPALLNDYVRPVCISRQSVKEGQKCVITGWGRSKKPDPTRSSIDPSAWPNLLTQAQVPITGEDRCAELYGTQLTNNMLCAGFPGGGVDTCMGDSGGPLLCESQRDGRWFVAGITSWAGREYNSCAEPLEPGVYTKTANYRDWITKRIFKESTDQHSTHHDKKNANPGTM